MPSSDFKELVVLESPQSVVVSPITYRIDQGRRLFSFTILRDFVTRDGERRRTPWLLRRHIDEIRALLDAVEGRLELEERKAREETAKLGHIRAGG